MRAPLLDLITKTICFEYHLENTSKGIDKSIYTTEFDHCYSSKDSSDLTEIIYNSIIDYSFNEFDLTVSDLQTLHTVALRTKLRFDSNADEATKLKYGFYGEVLLYAILCIIHKAKPLIARGYFYNPLEKAETKGYDSYHLVEDTNKIELWFGEVKFHVNYTSAINSALLNITKALSDGYLEDNILAIVNHKSNLNISGSTIEQIITSWEKNPSISIITELKKYKIKLVYPIAIVTEIDAKGYDETVSKIIKYIKDNYTLPVSTLSIDCSVFLIILPVKDVKKIKENTISWIESKKSLI